MTNIDEFLIEISKPRTTKDMIDYYREVKEKIHNDKDLLKLSREKKGLFREFYQEYLPLMKFAQSEFGSSESLYSVIIGNQNYDGIIISNQTETKVEITNYIDGKFFDRKAKELNREGVVFFDTDYENDLNQYFDGFIKNLEKKSNKKYSDTILLIVVPSEIVHLIFEDFNEDTLINRMRESIIKTFKGWNDVYLIIENLKENYSKDKVIKVI